MKNINFTHCQIFEHVFEVSLYSAIRQISYIRCKRWLFRERLARVTTTVLASTSVSPASLLTEPSLRQNYVNTMLQSLQTTDKIAFATIHTLSAMPIRVEEGECR